MTNDLNKSMVNKENVLTTEEKIEQLENSCKAMKEEIEKLKTELTEKNENETVWCPDIGKEYMYVDVDGRITMDINNNLKFDNNVCAMHNVFKPTSECKEHLEWYRDNILRVQNRLMQLHELLCPNYFPDWDTSKGTWIIYYDSVNKHFNCTMRYDCNCFVVCFTREAAEKACEILNKEKFMMEE